MRKDVLGPPPTENMKEEEYVNEMEGVEEPVPLDNEPYFGEGKSKHLFLFSN